MKELEKLKQKYERRLRTLETHTKKLHIVGSKETSYYSGMVDELEKVINDLNEIVVIGKIKKRNLVKNW